MMKVSLLHFAAGCGAGCLFVAALLLANVGGLGSLIAHDRELFLALFMLLTQLGGLFGMAVMISALRAEEEEASPRGRLRPSPAALPLRSPSR